MTLARRFSLTAARWPSCVATAAHALQEIRLRIGTVVPRGSLWHDTLQYIAQDWQRIVGPELKVMIHPGSQLGDESDMVRKARGGIIEAVGLSSVGLSRIDDGVSCLQVPMMFESYEELDYVRDRIAPKLERRIEATGFKVLHWADGGWVYVFTKKRRAHARRPATPEAVHVGRRSGDRASVQGLRVQRGSAVGDRPGARCSRRARSTRLRCRRCSRSCRSCSSWRRT